MRCKNCKAKIYYYSKYCDYCGLPIDSESGGIEENKLDLEEKLDLEKDELDLEKEILSGKQDSSFNSYPVTNDTYHEGKSVKRSSWLKRNRIAFVLFFVFAILIIGIPLVVAQCNKNPQEKIIIQDIKIEVESFNVNDFITRVDASVRNNNDTGIKNLKLQIRLVINYEDDGGYQYYYFEIIIDEMEAHSIKYISEVKTSEIEPIDCKIKILSVEFSE